jgi:hypothetical protein
MGHAGLVVERATGRKLSNRLRRSRASLQRFGNAPPT